MGMYGEMFLEEVADTAWNGTGIYAREWRKKRALDVQAI
jgi:hypothetical protein